jgi:Stage II sporulation protein M
MRKGGMSEVRPPVVLLRSVVRERVWAEIVQQRWRPSGEFQGVEASSVGKDLADDRIPGGAYGATPRRVEIPALLIAASYGLWLGVTVVQKMRGKESTLLRFHIEHAFRRYFAIVFPLLIIAAAIETALILKLGLHS